MTDVDFQAPVTRWARFVAFATGDAPLDSLDLRIERASSTSVTEDGDGYPVWTPDGTNVTCGSDRFGTYNMYSKAVDGTGVAEMLVEKVNDNVSRLMVNRPHRCTTQDQTAGY